MGAGSGMWDTNVYQAKQGWIWGGAGAGILASVLVAIVLQVVFAQIASGPSREVMEGVTGLLAAVFVCASPPVSSSCPKGTVPLCAGWAVGIVVFGVIGAILNEFVLSTGDFDRGDGSTLQR